MGQIERWAAKNATVPRESYWAGCDLPFVIWKRKWEVCELIGYREGSRQIVEQLSELAKSCDRYYRRYLIYKSKWEVFQGKFEPAYQTINGILAAAGEALSELERAEVLSQLSDASLHLSRFDEAIAHREKAAAIFRKRNDIVSYAQARTQIGLAKWKKGDYRGALADLREAEEIFQAFNDKALLAHIKINIANVFLALDEVEKAYHNYIEALEICRRIGDIARQSIILNNLGAVLYRKSLYQKAMECYLQGYELDRLLGNLSGQAAKLGNLAIMAASLGRYEEALEKFSLALKIERQTGSLEGQMKKLGNMASCYGLLGEKEPALACIDEALALARKIGSQGYLAFGLGLRADILSGLGRIDEAEENALEALKLAEECGNLSLVANGCIYLTEIYLEKALWAKALEYSARAVRTLVSHQLFEANQMLIYYLHYQTLTKVGRTDEAEKFLDKAYRVVMSKLDDLPPEVDRQELINKNVQYRKIIEERKRIREDR